MSVLSWDIEGKKLFCSRCLWRDTDPDVCHCIEPPIPNNPFVPTQPSDCYFIPEARWKQRPKEYQERDMAAREERSKRYWAGREAERKPE